MKKVVSFCIIVLTAVTSPAFSQTHKPQKTDKEILVLLCHNWQLVSTETHGKSYKLPDGKGSSLFIKQDGTLVEIDGDTNYPGKWTLNRGVVSVTNDGKGPAEDYKIIKITETELIYESNEDGSPVKMKMKRIK